jgi:hypothetical protein
MSKQTDKVNEVYDRYKALFSSNFHNDLWQIIVNERFEDEVVAFVYVPVTSKEGGHGVGIATKGESGYLPLNFSFVDGVPLVRRIAAIRGLNEAVFGLTEEQADEIVISSYRKPMEKARGTTVPPPHYNYGDSAGKALVKGNSVIVALQVRNGADFLDPTLHRVPSSKIASIIAQFQANMVNKEIRLTFPVEDELNRPNWIDYIGRLNGAYFRPKEPSQQD